MLGYFIRRLILMIPTLLIVSVLVFFLVRFIPGSAVDVMVSRLDLGSRQFEMSEKEQRDKIKHDLGLDAPIHIQYGRWVERLVMHGDLGKSLFKETPVTEEIIWRWPVTFELGLLALLVALLISFPIGIYSAVRQDTTGDYIARSFSVACIALPSFWVGTLVIVFPAFWWGWTPSVSYVPFFEDPKQNLIQFIIPAVVLGMALSGVNMRMLRTMMLEVLRQDYIRTAWSKGLWEKVVVTRHALKNALIPVITIIGLQIPVMIGGTVIIEQIFSLPGMGRLIVEASFDRDYPLLSGTVLILSAAVMLINLIVDITYAYIDPRIHYH